MVGQSGTKVVGEILLQEERRCKHGRILRLLLLLLLLEVEGEK